MSKHFKTIIPLLSNDLVLDDIKVENGFVGAFSYDINRPTLDQHIFLLYIYNVTNFFKERDARLKACPTFRSRRTVRIKGFLIVCYTFYNNQRSIRSIIDDRWLVNDEDKLRIFKFWNFTDNDINQYMLHPDINLFSETFKQVVIPEWDYDGKDINQSITIPKWIQQKPSCS